MSKKSFIDSVKVGSACSEKWEEMQGSERTRFCGHCAKDVNNLSALTRKEALRLVRSSNGNICIRYLKDPATNRPFFADQLLQMTRHRPGIAAGVMTASLSLANLTFAQERMPVQPANSVVVEHQADGTDDADKAADKDSEKKGVIEGILRDHDGRPVSGIDISLSDGSVEGTDEHGFYRFKDVDPGTYAIRIEATSGNLKKAAPEIAVSGGQTIEEDLTVRVLYKKQDSVVGYSNSIVGTSSGGAMAMVEYSNPLTSSVESGDVEAVKELLRTGAKVNGREPSYEGITPLFIAIENNKIEIVRLLLQYGAKINITDKSGRTPLMFIDEEATPQLVTELIQAGVKVNVHAKNGDTPLSTAVEAAKVEVVQALLDGGADVDSANSNKITPLMLAADGGKLDIVKLLTTADADVNLKDDKGETAWDKSSDPEIDKALVDAGAMVNYDVEVLVMVPTTLGDNVGEPAVEPVPSPTQ